MVDCFQGEETKQHMTSEDFEYSDMFMMYLELESPWSLSTFHYMEKSSMNIIQNISRKWHDMRVSKR